MKHPEPYRLSIIRTDERWKDKAACRGLDETIFFPERDGKPIIGGRRIYDKARVICAKCPVRVNCLQYAFHFNMIEFGMWGGLAPHERKLQFSRMRKLKKSIQHHIENS
jgi:WhiB family redox-sensing transcriptional regulator